MSVSKVGQSDRHPATIHNKEARVPASQSFNAAVQEGTNSHLSFSPFPSLPFPSLPFPSLPSLLSPSLSSSSHFFFFSRSFLLSFSSPLLPWPSGFEEGLTSPSSARPGLAWPGLGPSAALRTNGLWPGIRRGKGKGPRENNLRAARALAFESPSSSTD
ncbi:hypothetical protein LY78DRAFT_226029 [Colletotrichum sublineola]|nr:hypothetical protein LY78DRAFT_226029 [Colletotrichum sublineola]